MVRDSLFSVGARARAAAVAAAALVLTAARPDAPQPRDSSLYFLAPSGSAHRPDLSDTNGWVPHT